MNKLIINIMFLFLVSSLASQNQKNMVKINAGVYTPLYSLDSQSIQVDAFLMDIYPVTNSDFKKFVKENPSWSKSQVKTIFADKNYLLHWTSDTTFSNKIALSPVVNISWFAAKMYCECLGKRLPTTAEWELAAKASANEVDASKNTAFNQYLINWISKPNPSNLPNVGSTFKNYYGVWDLHGLVWEWTFDFNSALTTGESRGNSDLDNSFFCGGGSFASKNIENYASFMRFASRSSVKANYGIQNMGFRCVKNLN
jgi:sulfatase modifying factor 1